MCTHPTPLTQPPTHLALPDVYHIPHHSHNLPLTRHSPMCTTPHTTHTNSHSPGTPQCVPHPTPLTQPPTHSALPDVYHTPHHSHNHPLTRHSDIVEDELTCARPSHAQLVQLRAGLKPLPLLQEREQVYSHLQNSTLCLTRDSICHKQEEIINLHMYMHVYYCPKLNISHG